MSSLGIRRLFGLMDRFSLIPLFRAGLGPLIGNPLTGYIMVMKTTGRRTGRPHYTPMNYAILDGNVCCIVRWGQAAHWYANVRAHPQVELLLPDRTIVGIAEQVTDPQEAIRVIRQVLQNGGFAGFTQGVSPFSAPDHVLREHTQGMIALRIRPAGIGSGPADPGGRLWVLLALGMALLLWLARRRRSR